MWKELTHQWRQDKLTQIKHNSIEQTSWSKHGHNFSLKITIELQTAANHKKKAKQKTIT